MPNVLDPLYELGSRVYSPNNPPGAQAPGSIALATGGVLRQYQRIALSSTDRLTLAGTGRVVLEDLGRTGPLGEPGLVLGTPRSPSLSFTVPDGYDLNANERLSLLGAVRATLQGSARLTVTDDFKTRSRIVLSGVGG